MTQKQKLVAEITEVLNTLKQFEYRPWFKVEDCPTMTIAALKAIVEELKTRLASENQIKANHEFFSNDEYGKTVKTRIDNLFKKIENREAKFLEILKTEVEVAIKQTVNLKHWNLCVHKNDLEMYMVDKEGKTIFGHNFSGYFNFYTGEKPTLKWNYGALGSFDPAEEPSRVEFLEMLTKIVGNANLNSRLVKLYTDYAKALKELWKINNELTAITVAPHNYTASQIETILNKYNEK